MPTAVHQGVSTVFAVLDEAGACRYRPPGEAALADPTADLPWLDAGLAGAGFVRMSGWDAGVHRHPIGYNVRRVPGAARVPDGAWA